MKNTFLLLSIFLIYGVLQVNGQSLVTNSEKNFDVERNNTQSNPTNRSLITVFPFIETFEDDSPSRDSWTQIQETGTNSWTFSEDAGGGAIPFAYEGIYNAKFTSSPDGPHITKLVSPEMDLTTLITPELVFWYAQDRWNGQNELKIYYRTSSSEPWTEIAFFNSDVPVWTKETTTLPNPSATYQIAFEGIDNYGYSNVLDNITVRETPTNTVDWCNLESPGELTVIKNDRFDIFAQVFEDGVTNASSYAAGEGIECWFGYSHLNTDPSTWTNWEQTSYNQDVGANDEFDKNIGIYTCGTYYCASRFRYQDGPYTYGGYSSTGGGIWDGVNNVSGVVTITTETGYDCSNPYIVNIPEDYPYQALSQTTFGYDNYTNTNISNEDYDNCSDAIYKLNITSNTSIKITLDPKTSEKTSLSLFDACPDSGELIADAFDEGSDLRIIEANLTTGIYYIMVDKAPSPYYIEEYDLAIEPVCFEPLNIEEINLTQTSTDIQWTAGNFETSWNIKVNKATPIDPLLENGNIVVDSLITGNPIYSIASGLTLDTDYYVYVQSDCGSDWVSYMFTTPVSCPVPTRLTETHFGSNNVLLSWDELGVNDWTIKISTSQLSDPENETADIVDNYDVTGGNAEYNLTGLNPDLTYYWYVKSICGSDWSEEAEFSTSCTALEIPYFEDFTGVPTGNIPNCWDRTHTNWGLYPTNIAGGEVFELRFNWDPESTDEFYAYLPTIDATSESNLILSFLHSVDYYQDTFELRIDYTIDNGLTWNTAWQDSVTDNIAPEEVFVDLTPLVDGEIFQLAFVYSGNSYNINYWYIDDIKIRNKILIDQVDKYSRIEDLYMCIGTDEVDALAELESYITVSLENGSEYNVAVTWAFDDYDSSTPGEYIAKGTYTFPSDIEPISGPHPETTCTVTINDRNTITFSFDTVFCIGADSDYLPVLSDNSIWGVWNSEFIFTSIIGETEYYFIPEEGQCTDIDTVFITSTVNYPNEAEFSFQTDYCLGETPDILSSVSDDNYPGTWIPDTIMTDTVSIIDYTFIPFDGECSLATTIQVSVTEIPVVTCPDDLTITKDSIITLSAMPEGGIYSGTGVTDNSFDPSLLTNGDYTITYTYSDTGCSNSCEFTITVNIIDNIDRNNIAEIKIYPNPSNGTFTLNFDNINGNIIYQIYDTKGSIIAEKNLYSYGKTSEEVSHNLIPGIYYLKLITENKSYVEKLVIE